MSQAGVYNQLKPTWWAAREGLKWPDAPKQIQLILSDLCSHDCRWCAYRWTGYTSNELFTAGAELSKYGHNNPIRFIPTERVMRLLDEFKEVGALGVQYTGGGESTLHKDHESIYRRTLDLGIRCALVSNGDSWGPSLATEILPRFDWVRVSVDAGTPETYSQIRRIHASKWNRVWGHIEQLARSIRDSKSETTLGVGYVVAPESWQEISECCRIAKDKGANNVRLTAVFSPENEKPYLDIYDKIRFEIVKVKERYEDDNFKVYDNFGSRIEDLKLGNPDYTPCGYMRYTTYIGADQNNYMCCVYSYNKRGLMASIKDQSFAEWWRSPERKAFMDNFDAKGCERCQFNEINRALNYVRGNTESGTVKHVEWT